MARNYINTNFASQISNGNSAQKDIEIPEGGELHITGFSVSAVSLANIFVKLVWDLGGEDEDIFFECSGNGVFEHLDYIKIGDGTKKLSIIIEHSNEAIGTVGLSATVEGYYSI